MTEKFNVDSESLIKSKQVEYSEIHNFLRYLLDYRTKIFNFAVALNGALLTLVLVHIQTNNFFAKIILSILGLAISIIFFFAERRTIFVFYEYLIDSSDLFIRVYTRHLPGCAQGGGQRDHLFSLNQGSQRLSG